MNDAIWILLGLLSILLMALIPLGIGGVLQAFRKKTKISLSIIGASGLALVLLQWWLMEWTMIVIFDALIPSIIGSFLLTWLLMEIGSTIVARQFDSNRNRTQNKSRHGTA